jgi:flavin-dependent dehydrogenase
MGIERSLTFVMLIGLLLPSADLLAQNGPVQNFDVVVYGATAGGAMAAIAAGQMGMRVALVDPGAHVGGMVSGGLSHSDVDRQEKLIGGLALQFFHRVATHYALPNGWSFEPHVAEEIFRSMLKDAHVQLFPGEQISGVDRRGATIVVLRTIDGRAFHGRAFIDSSYEGDLMKDAGVSYTVGREGQQKYDESLAGRMDLLPGVAPVCDATPVGRIDRRRSRS